MKVDRVRGVIFESRLWRIVLPSAFVLLFVPSSLAQKASATMAPEDGQWVMPAKDYASTRFSGLDAINTSNVKSLALAWTFNTGVNRGQEAAPIVVGSTMYVITPFPNTLYALDLANKGAVLWKYESKPAPAAQGVACCDVVNRGCVYWEERVFFNA